MHCSSSAQLSPKVVMHAHALSVLCGAEINKEVTTYKIQVWVRASGCERRGFYKAFIEHGAVERAVDLWSADERGSWLDAKSRYSTRHWPCTLWIRTPSGDVLSSLPPRKTKKSECWAAQLIQTKIGSYHERKVASFECFIVPYPFKSHIIPVHFRGWINRNAAGSAFGWIRVSSSGWQRTCWQFLCLCLLHVTCYMRVTFDLETLVHFCMRSFAETNGKFAKHRLDQ